MADELDRLTTEAAHPASRRLDTMSAAEIVALMNREDAAVVAAVGRIGAEIAAAIEVIAERLRCGGRLLYVGAGTSGRLGVLDASECPPTFCTPPELVVGVIAGGEVALTRAIEGAEDDPDAGAQAMDAQRVAATDVVVGIAASGRTPFVLGAVARAAELGAFTMGLSCNQSSQLAAAVEIELTPVVGPEVVAGSTRLKAGTATKMVLNMLTTGAMVRLGKVYGNLMVDLQATNDKLRARAIRIVAQLTDLDEADSALLLSRCDGEVKTATIVHRCRVTVDEARLRLAAAAGALRDALEDGG